MNKKARKKPVLLCILDGWGLGDEKDPQNAIARAKTPNYDRILKQYPFSRLETSGLAVGLPEGQIGNSEVGHMTIGAGRVIFQDLVRINNSLKNSELAKNPDLTALIADLKQSGKVAHLCGLFSDGGVHAHLDHIIFLANLLAENGVKVLIHAFLDGRDVAQKSALKFYDEFVAKINKNVEIATVSGRYYAMDRDLKWDRVKLAYDAIIEGKAPCFSGFQEVINEAYENDIFDEFVKPAILKNYNGAKDGDALIFCNFRADRARQISQALIDPEFKEFLAHKINFSHKLALTSYSESLDRFYKVIFKSQKITNSLPEVLANQGLTQLRIAETEKYAHVTFFFSCGKEQEMSGESRILVPSPNVATYDLMPEMSCGEVGKNLAKAIESQEFDFIVVNYANPDMVGHSGDLNASIKACQAIDEQIGMLEKVIIANDGALLISADHGNIECMEDESGNPHTSHTVNLVPFILISSDAQEFSLQDGNLSDIAPTILDLMKLEKPSEMTGLSLINKK